MKKPNQEIKVIAQNKKAYYEYFIEEEVEAGIVLVGNEVKSLRFCHPNISESYADNIQGDIYIIGLNIPEYKNSMKFFQYHPKRKRKILLHKREIKRLIGLKERKGYTLVPLKLYFNKRNIAKVSLGIAKGKKKYDKRYVIKQREWDREKARASKNFE